MPTNDPTLRARALAAYTVVAAGLVIWVLYPFFTTLVIAAVIAAILRPLYLWLLARWPHPTALSVMLTAVVVVAVLVPMALVVTLAVGEVGAVSQEISQRLTAGDSGRLDALSRWLAQYLPYPVEAVTEQIQSQVGEIGRGLLSNVGRGAAGIFSATALVSLQGVILLFAVPSFLEHGRGLADRIARLSPLERTLEDQLLRIFRGFSRGFVFGGLVTAVLQGLVAGVGYAIAGVPHALFWAVLTGVFSFVPVVGTALIWGPLTLGLLLDDAGGMALFLGLYSLILTGGVDNLVRPWLIGQDSTLPTLWLFLSIFGGLLAFGAAGLVVGPVAVSFLLALLAVYERAPDPAPLPGISPNPDKVPPAS